MKIFLTGGTGLLGSHFAALAKDGGAEITALVRPNSDRSFLESIGVTYATGDLKDMGSLASGMKGCDAVVHAASPIGGWASPRNYQENTIDGTSNLIVAMVASGVKTLIHISTVSVHGLDPIRGRAISEADGFSNQFLRFDHYGRAKVAVEKIIREAHQAGKINATILRPGWMYGPRDNNSYGRFADLMRKGLAVKVGDGLNRVPLVHAWNIAWAVWLALVKESPDFRVFIIANDGQVTQNDYLASVARAANFKRRLFSLPKWLLLGVGVLQEILSVLLGYKLPVLLSRYVVHLIGSECSFDQTLIEKELGYSPLVTYEQGFKETEAWYWESRG